MTIGTKSRSAHALELAIALLHANVGILRALTPRANGRNRLALTAIAPPSHTMPAEAGTASSGQ